MKVQLSVGLTAYLLLTGCNGSDDDISEPDVPVIVAKIDSLTGSAPRQAKSSDTTDMLLLAQNNSQFVIDLYQQQRVDSEGENLIASPLSISMAFASLYAGSANETKQELQNTLHFTQQDEVFHQAFNTLSQSLLPEASDADFTLNIVNAQWGEASYDFNSDYLDTLSQYYGAGINVADIIGQPDEVRTSINDWVAEQTESLIEDLLPENSITTDTRLVLTNAVYLNAKWQAEFSPSETSERVFTLLSGEEIQVSTMSQRGDFNAFVENDEILVELPYKNADWSMYLVSAPVEQFSDFEASFNVEKFDDMLVNASVQDIKVWVPKFSFGTDVDLKSVLQPLGINLAFNGSAADFSLVNQRLEMELSIQTAVHKAFITVDEAGTEAGAATAIGMGITSVPPLYPFDQPFLFVIRHKPTSTNLFMGRVLNPLQE